MPIIIIITLAIYIVLIAWIWQNLGNIKKTKKVAVIIISLIIIYIITLIIFNISKSGIIYQNEESQIAVQNMLVAVFTAINGLILIPYIAKQLEKIHEGEIEKDQFTKKMLIIFVIFTICAIIECGYLKDTQEGILTIYNSSIK